MSLPALATLADLAGVMRVPVDDVDETYGNLMLELASDLVRDETGQRIDLVEDDSIDMPGPGVETLLLPELPVIAVTTVTLVGELGAENEVITDASTDGGGYRLERGYDGRSGILRRLSGRWPKRAPVRIVYDHGYPLASIPGGIRLVVCYAASRGMVGEVGIKQETVGRYSVTYSDVGLMLTGTDLAILERYYPGTAAGAR